MRLKIPHISLLVLLCVALLARTRWEWIRVVLPEAPRVVTPEGREETPPLGLWHYSDGTHWERGILLTPGSRLLASVSRISRPFKIHLQGDSNDEYIVAVSADGHAFQEIWRAPAGETGGGLVTRESPLIHPPLAFTFLRVAPAGGDGYFSVSWLSLRERSAEVAPWTVAACLAAFFLLLRAIRRLSGSALLTRVFDFWEPVEPFAAAGLIYLTFFRVPQAMLVPLVVLASIVLVLLTIRRYPLLSIGAILAGAVAVEAVLIPSLRAVVTANISKFYHLNVDHRMRPFVNPDVNSDGIRFRGEAADLEEGEFVVAFMGDSFTFGEHLAYEEAYPYQFQSLVDSLRCTARVRAVNFGWTSSSPLLGLRLLREIGFKYRPDLIVYNLDMTDFDDDLRYELKLRHGNDYQIDVGAIIPRLLATRFPRLYAFLPDPGEAAKLLRAREPAEEKAIDRVHGGRFFATAFPLEQTRGELEAGVVKNLAAIHRFAGETLNSKMALVVAPRAYQYSDRESPANWEKNEYVTLGPFVREPFRFFAEAAPSLPYPVISLLEPFEKAQEFPLYMEDDPHWNAAGSRLAARSVLSELLRRDLLPCGKAVN